jgi:hypothetical protein
MRTITAGWKRVAFAVAVAGALGFGATQAVAEPREAESQTAACGATACQRTCPEYGGSWVNGRCICCYPA